MNARALGYGLAFVGGMAMTTCAYEPDISKFPADEAEIPARLENMRPGQIRDAAAKGAVCLLPIGVIEAEAPDQPLGIDAAWYDRAIVAMATEKKAIIAPPIWFGPTGYILSGPDQTVKRQMIREIEACSSKLRNIPIYLSRFGLRVWETKG